MWTGEFSPRGAAQGRGRLSHQPRGVVTAGSGWGRSGQDAWGLGTADTPAFALMRSFPSSPVSSSLRLTDCSENCPALPALNTLSGDSMGCARCVGYLLNLRVNEDSFQDPHSCDHLLSALPFEILAMSHFSQIRSLKMGKVSAEVSWLINRSCSGYCEACGPHERRRHCWE